MSSAMRKCKLPERETQRRNTYVLFVSFNENILLVQLSLHKVSPRGAKVGVAKVQQDQ